MRSLWSRIRHYSIVMLLILGGVVVNSFQNCARIEYNKTAETLDSNQSLNVNVDVGPEVDSDEDGLSDDLEISIGTDPNNPDTDGGGVSDGVEVENEKDPLNKKDDIHLSDDDKDGDGLTDREECVIGTNPYKKDSDFGGIHDGDEVQRGLNPLNPKDDHKVHKNW